MTEQYCCCSEERKMLVQVHKKVVKKCFELGPRAPKLIWQKMKDLKKKMQKNALFLKKNLVLCPGNLSDLSESAPAPVHLNGGKTRGKWKDGE